MSAKEHDHSAHSEDNYEAAYAPSAMSEETPAVPTPAHGFWKSLRELEGTAKLQTDKGNNEFPPGLIPEAGAEGVAVIDPMHRRNFFQLMGASMALAGVGACRYEKEDIVPLARRPEHQVPGQTQEYATAFELGGVGQALVATSFEGRPIRLDGNPEHPYASGNVVTGTQRHAGASTFAIASILHMYDPDRSTSATSSGKGAMLSNFVAALPALRTKLATGRILSEATSSPTVAALRRRLLAQFPGLQWHEYEPVSHDSERLGMRLAFGRVVRPLPQLERAETVVALDADFLCDHPAGLKLSRDFARARRVDGWLPGAKMNRLYAIESAFSNTGAMADHRLGVRSEHCLPIALAIDAALAGGQPSGAEVLKETRVTKFLNALVEELKQNRGKSVVIAGRKQPPEVHAIVARINQAIGAPGATLDYIEDPEPERASHLAAISTLANDMKSGRVGTLFILGGNPVYDAPADLDFAAALTKVETSIHLHEYVNETSLKTTWHLPRAHFLEAWGDTRTWDGTITIAQPLLAPLYGGISPAELIALLLGDDTTGEALVRGTHEQLGVAGTWRQHVHDGFVAGTQLPLAEVSVTDFPVPQLTPSQLGSSKRPNGQIEVTFQPSGFAYDGRFANNAWLQETPDFLSKVTWDNYALVGPETADVLKLGNDTMIRVKIGDRELTLPCYTMPGQARYSIALLLGGGRTAAGRVGGTGDSNRVGWDTYRVRTTSAFDLATTATVTPTGDEYELASVQEHWDIRKGLDPSVTQKGIAERLPELVRTTTHAELAANPTWKADGGVEQYWDDSHVDAGGAKRHLSLFREQTYTGHRWGMAIDLTTCTGCNSCMVACQAENNVPVVGRQEVINNREMHWIRIDRYFSGTPEEPLVMHQPLTCQQCENAPCEQVCPVGATQHSDEGLNDMAYNRCIGTRYCANNCPYKVRRFNFLDWNKEWRDGRNKVRRLLFNPEVTVRMRGVMEKCTFCVQRIQNAKIHARAQVRTGQRTGDANAPLVDGEVTVACQQACPSEAITFGDLADPNSRVSKAHADRRSYDLLPEVYTKPRNQYLARVRNPNPKLEPLKAVPSDAARGESH